MRTMFTVCTSDFKVSNCLEELGKKRRASQFVERAVEAFLKTEDGQKTLNFMLTAPKRAKGAVKQPAPAAYNQGTVQQHAEQVVQAVVQSVPTQQPVASAPVVQPVSVQEQQIVQPVETSIPSAPDSVEAIVSGIASGTTATPEEGYKPISINKIFG